MKARDCSNYSVPLTPALLAEWQTEGIGLVIIQAFPGWYRQYPQQRDQMRACAAAGLPFDCYIYDYLGDPTWRDICLDGLAQAESEEGLKPRKLWLDEEDVETGEGWANPNRAAAIEWSWQVALGRGYTVGIYTGRWWWEPRVGVMDLSGSVSLWASQYDGIADASVFTPFGGWATCAIKQYAGSQPDGTDLNVLSAEEEASVAANCDTYKAAIDRAVQRLWLELAKKNLSKKPLREIADELVVALQA